MKRSTAFLITALAAGFCLAACGNPVPPPSPVAPTPTVVPAPTLANPTAVASPTVRVEPTTTPTASPFPGTMVSFDRLSLVIPTGVGTGGSGTLVPEAKGDEVAPWDVAPDHIQFKLDGYALGGEVF